MLLVMSGENDSYVNIWVVVLLVDIELQMKVWSGCGLTHPKMQATLQGSGSHKWGTRSPSSKFGSRPEFVEGNLGSQYSYEAIV